MPEISESMAGRWPARVWKRILWFHWKREGCLSALTRYMRAWRSKWYSNAAVRGIAAKYRKFYNVIGINLMAEAMRRCWVFPYIAQNMAAAADKDGKVTNRPRQLRFAPIFHHFLREYDGSAKVSLILVRRHDNRHHHNKHALENSPYTVTMRIFSRK